MQNVCQCTVFTAVFVSCVGGFVDGRLNARQLEQAGNIVATLPQIDAENTDVRSLSSEQMEACRLLLSELDSQSFSIRIQGSKKLKGISTDEITYLSGLAAGQASAEVVIRILAEVDNRYSAGQEQDVRAASETLEALITAKRLLLADTAASILLEHSDKRIDLAKEALQNYGAIVRDGTPMGNFFPGMRGGNSQSLVVMLSEKWTGQDEGLKVFERLATLFETDSLRPGGVTVYLIDGNPLTEQQEAKLAEQVGHTRLVRRGPVALGIVGDQRIGGGGVLIGQVSPGGTADRGGLNRGDLLLAMEPTKRQAGKAEVESGDTTDSVEETNADASLKNSPVDETGQQKPVVIELDDVSAESYLQGDKRRLLDFDDLVERLKAFKIGDEVTVHVIRGYDRFRTNLLFGGRRFNIPGDAPPNTHAALKVELVKMKLMGWADVKVLQ